MRQAVTLRPASRTDAPQLAALHGAHFARGWTAKEFTDLFEQQTILSFVAEEANAAQLCGFIFCRLMADESEILSLVVTAPQRRRNLATRLCHTAFQHAVSHGAKQITLEVSVTNHSALALYTKLGFETLHRRLDYYRMPDGSREDALIMQCSLVGYAGAIVQER